MEATPIGAPVVVCVFIESPKHGTMESQIVTAEDSLVTPYPVVRLLNKRHRLPSSQDKGSRHPPSFRRKRGGCSMAHTAGPAGSSTASLIDAEVFSRVWRNSFFIRCLCLHLTSKDVFRLMHVCRELRDIFWRDIFDDSLLSREVQNQLEPVVGGPRMGNKFMRIQLPLAYCGMEDRWSRFAWLSNSEVTSNRSGGLSLTHVILDGTFHAMPQDLQVRFLWRLNFVVTLRFDVSFLTCFCPACRSLTTPLLAASSMTTAPIPTRSPRSRTRRGGVRGPNELNAAEETEAEGDQDAPAVFAAFAAARPPVANSQGGGNNSPDRTQSPLSLQAVGLLPSTAGQPPNSGDTRSANPSPATSTPSPDNLSPEIATVEAPEGYLIHPLHLDNGSSGGSPSPGAHHSDANSGTGYEFPGPLGRNNTAILHAFEKLTLAFQIAYRNRCMLQELHIIGPPAPFSTALMRDDELPKLPFPLKPKQSSTAVRTQVMPRFDEESGQRALESSTTTSPTNSRAEINSNAKLSEATKRPPLFSKLRKVVFGSSVDCRYIVPFLDYSDFSSLTSVTVGRLVAEYTYSKPQFGDKATVMFAPQHIFNQVTFPAAPHLPAIYNGAIDENLRFQGSGIFVCDEYTYEGEFQDGVNNGFGHMKSAAGEMYTGEWKHGQRNGRGKVVQQSGDSLTGHWVNDSLGGLGILDTADGFSYVGNWYHSRFEGWGSIWYHGVLICYGRFSRGLLSGWSRILRFSATSDKTLGLTWEESRHDETGRVQRCCQITVLQRSTAGEEPEAEEMLQFFTLKPLDPQQLEGLEKKRLLVRNSLEDLIRGPEKGFDTTEALASANCRVASNVFEFAHDFPDEESLFGSSGDSEPDDLSSADESESAEWRREVGLEEEVPALSSRGVPELHTPFGRRRLIVFPATATNCCMSPAARVFEDRPRSSQIAHRETRSPFQAALSTSSSLEAVDTPWEALDSSRRREEWHGDASTARTPDSQSAIVQPESLIIRSQGQGAGSDIRATNACLGTGNLARSAPGRQWLPVEVASPTGRPQMAPVRSRLTRLRSERHNSGRGMASTRERPLARSPRTPPGERTPEPRTIEVSSQVPSGQNRLPRSDHQEQLQSAIEGTNPQGADNEVLGAPPPPTPGVVQEARASSSRSRPALVQAINTAEQVKGHCEKNGIDPEEIWRHFKLWDQVHFANVHCDWLQEQYPRRIYSPLDIPAGSEVPKWLRTKIWKYYDYPGSEDLVDNPIAMFDIDPAKWPFHGSPIEPSVPREAVNEELP